MFSASLRTTKKSETLPNQTNMDKDFDIVDSFCEWCKKLLIKRSSSYGSNLKGFQRMLCDFFTKHDIDKVWVVESTPSYDYDAKQFAKKALLGRGSASYDFLEAVNALIKEDDLLYATTIIDAMCYIADKFKAEVIAYNDDKRTFGDCCSALNKFRQYVKTEFSDSYWCGEDSSANELYRKAVNKGMLSKIDGIENLIAVIGEEQFVKLAVEKSFFFDKDLVVERMNEMIELLAKGEALPARRTTKDQEKLGMYHQKDGYFFDGEQVKMPVKVSKDGNDFVRKIIKDRTGFTACEGKGSILQNYIISHLWGRAYDPRYYTNLWNVVLVPAWANSLLDKDAAPSSFAARLKATFMRVSMKLYLCSKQKTKLQKLQLDVKNLSFDAKPFKGEYEITQFVKKDANVVAVGGVKKDKVKI